MSFRAKRSNLILFVFLLLVFSVYSGQAEEQKKIKVAVLPPSASGDASASVSQGLTSVIVTELSRSPNLEVSDRRDVDKALKEQAFGQAGYCEQSCQIEIGKILQSKWVVTGDLNKIGTLYILTLKILNVETSKIEYQDEEEYKGEVEGLVPKTKALTSRLADFLVTGKKPKVVKEKPKEENKKTTEQKKKQETKEVNKKKVAVVVPSKNVDTSGMVYIPAGYFWMGSDEEEINTACAEDKKAGLGSDCDENWFKNRKIFNNEKPKHQVYLDAYYIDKYEVTNTQYKKCVKAGKCNKPQNAERYDNAEYASHPVEYVNWFTSDAYCKWAGKRLPTEAEWEKAARGENGNIWPWGNEFDCSKSCNSLPPCKQNSACAIGSYASDTSSYGVMDMAGNVEEWVSDWYDGDYYEYSPDKNPKGPNSGKEYKVMRGGSWDDFGHTAYLRGAYRVNGYLSSGSSGFRCAADAK